MKQWQAKSLLLFGTSIWGATFLFTKIGIQDCSPSLYLLFRFTIALALCLIFFGKHIIKIEKRTIKQGSLLGIFWTIGFLLQTYALQYTTIGNAAFITNLAVGLTPFVYWFISREKIKFFSKIAVLMGFIGVNIIADPLSNDFNIGDLLIFISTFMWAGYVAFLHLFTKEDKNNKKDKNIVRSSQLTATQFAIGIPILIIFILIFDNEIHINFTNELITSLLFNAVMASFLISFIQISVQRYTTPVSAVLIFSLEPIFASIISFFAIGEVLTLRGYIGAAIMMLAIFVSDTLEVVINYFKNKMAKER